MSGKVVTKAQLQEAALRGYQASGEVAAAAAEAVQELLELIKADKRTWNEYTLDATAWVTNTDTTTASAYPMAYNLTVADATADDSADAVFAVESQDVVAEAGICTTHYVGDGTVTFYAVQTPTTDIALKLCLIETADETEATA